MTVLLGAIAGFTIFLGLPIARARRLSPQTIALLNALAIGILLYLVVEIAQNAIVPISQGLTAWHASPAPFPVGTHRRLRCRPADRVGWARQRGDAFHAAGGDARRESDRAGRDHRDRHRRA